MRTKRISVKTEECQLKVTTQTVDVELDFTQLYNQIYYMSLKIKNTSTLKILFYLLKNMSDDNTINIDQVLAYQFSKDLNTHAKKTISKRHFQNCIEELIEAKIIIRARKGFYVFNPYVLWKDEVDKRYDLIRSDISGGAKTLFNPFELGKTG